MNEKIFIEIGKFKSRGELKEKQPCLDMMIDLNPYVIVMNSIVGKIFLFKKTDSLVYVVMYKKSLNFARQTGKTFDTSGGTYSIVETNSMSILNSLIEGFTSNERDIKDIDKVAKIIELLHNIEVYNFREDLEIN